LEGRARCVGDGRECVIVSSGLDKDNFTRPVRAVSTGNLYRGRWVSGVDS
jgi:hypothetical protein